MHIPKVIIYKILWLKIAIFLFFLILLTTSFSNSSIEVFLEKNCRGPLGINIPKNIENSSSLSDYISKYLKN